MSRFSFVLLAVVLASCSGPAPTDIPLIRLSPAPRSAFGVEADAPAGVPQEWRQKINPAELLADAVDFPAMRLLPTDEVVPAERVDAPEHSVLSILREFVAPGKWDANALRVEGGELVARQAPAVLAALQSVLQTLRNNRGRLIRTRVRMHTLPADALARFENIPPVGGGLVGTFERAALEQALREADPQEANNAFVTLTTLHGQKSNVIVVNQKAYVAGYAPEGDGYDPRVAVAAEGVVTELRSVANGSPADGFLVSFEVQLAGPTEVVDIPLRSGVVQMPAQGYARLSGRCSLRPDQVLLVVTRNPDLRKSERPILAVTIWVDWHE